ncbi:MAG: type II toxin-antitoxin system VapC family toxin [bacterium]
MIIIDTSVAVKWIIPGEDFEEQSFALMESHINYKDPIMVPDLFYYEISNTIATKTTFPTNKINSTLNKIYDLQLRSHISNAKEIIKTTLLARKYKTSFYDMLYAVVAKHNKCQLITADRKFIEKTKFPHVIHISEYK